MDYLLKELEERFKKISELEKEFVEPYALPKAPQALREYLLFIEETSPFNTIVREIREKSQTSGIVLLDKIRTGTAGIVDMKVARPFARVLHLRLVAAVEEKIRAGRTKLVFYKKEGKVCLFDDESHCYPTKEESPQRFKIVEILWGTKVGKSAAEIAELLGKDSPQSKSVQDNIKDDIGTTNKRFIEKIKTDLNLILSSRPGKKNIYSLNRVDFLWVDGKGQVR